MTANDPTEAIAFDPPARSTVPPTPDVLCSSVVAVIVPVATWVTPPPVADRSTVGADSISPVFSAMPPLPATSNRSVVAPTLPVAVIVGALSEMFVAVSFPAAVRLPVSTSVKSPPVTANEPTEAIAFDVPARSTVPVTPDALCSTVSR